jgi:hypothetical protein
MINRPRLITLAAAVMAAAASARITPEEARALETAADGGGPVLVVGDDAIWTGRREPLARPRKPESALTDADRARLAEAERRRAAKAARQARGMAR